MVIIEKATIYDKSILKRGYPSESCIDGRSYDKYFMFYVSVYVKLYDLGHSLSVLHPLLVFL